jgi:hypothetical protein
MRPSVRQQHVHHRREAVGGAARVGDDVVLGGVVLLVVDAHDDGDVLTLGRCRDDHLLGARGQVPLGLLGLREKAGRLDHVVDAQLLPGELRRRLGADDQDLFAVDREHVVCFLVGARLLGADLAGELPLHRIVFQQVGEVVGGDDVAHRDHLDLFSEEPLLVQGAEHEATDPTETVDSDTSAHCVLPFLSECDSVILDARLYMTRGDWPSQSLPWVASLVRKHSGP